ncbi:hypothetical protein [Pectinatus frisingensis]|uniref:hypothetical protein n=1 Tax=Pectinatus frisingensis TaxID=865 RepID=UPI0018C75278|nr:hypothetical protein [Pectinatus frisingensis]
MNAKEIQEQIDNLNYWDSEVLQLGVDYFGDEVTIVFDNTKLLFTGCIQVHINTDPQDRKIPIKTLTRKQLPYFMQSIEVTSFQTKSLAVVHFGGNKLPEPTEKFNLFKCKMLMPPLNVEIYCSSINIKRNII